MRPRNKGKGLLSCATSAKRVRIQAVQQRKVEKKIV